MVESRDAKGRVHVRLKVGSIDVEVECGVDEVGDVVSRVLEALAESGGVVADGASSSGRVGVSYRETCKGLILDLWREGWFGLGRSLGEVHGEMGRRGFHYDRTAVAHALVDLVREGVLTREGRPRRYRYLQKRPPPTVAKTKKSQEK